MILLKKKIDELEKIQEKFNLLLNQTIKMIEIESELNETNI